MAKKLISFLMCRKPTLWVKMLNKHLNNKIVNKLIDPVYSVKSKKSIKTSLSKKEKGKR